MSTEQNPTNASVPQPRDWNRPRPGKLPEPTAWPAGVALAITFILWGFVSSFMVSAVGLAMFVTAIAGWIREIRHEREQE